MTRITQNLLILMLALSVANPAFTAAEAPVVNNPAEPPLVETWQLYEAWHLGGEDADDDEPLLGVISKGVVDEGGHILLLDTQLAHVLEISPAGDYLQTLGGMGEGPGEVQRPQDICLLSDGTIGLVQSYPAKIVKLNRDGTPAGNVTVDTPAINYFRLRSVGGVTVVTGQRNDYDNSDPTTSETYRFIKSIEPTGEDRHTYLDGTFHTQWQPPVTDEKKSFFPGYQWDLTGDGTMVLAPGRDRFFLEFIDPVGVVVRTAERSFAPHVRSQQDKQKIRDGMSMSSNGKQLEVKKIILDTDRAITSVTALHDGTIWVETCFGRRDLPAGVFRRYDVLDAEGHLLKEVHLMCDARAEEDGFALLADGRFLWIRNLTSAYRSMYPSLQKNEEEMPADDDDVMLKVVILERS